MRDMGGMAEQIKGSTKMFGNPDFSVMLKINILSQKGHIYVTSQIKNKKIKKYNCAFSL